MPDPTHGHPSPEEAFLARFALSKLSGTFDSRRDLNMSPFVTVAVWGFEGIKTEG